MTNIVVAFSKPEDAKNIKNILTRSGFSVHGVCTSGAQALSFADGLGSGILVCGCRFADMMYDELHDCLPAGISMLLMASPSQLNGSVPEDVVCLSMPLKVHDLVNTLEMMVQASVRRKNRLKARPKERSSEEKELIDQAKLVLIERNGMTEAEAHRYIQKYSMDSGSNMVETAQMIISMTHV